VPQLIERLSRIGVLVRLENPESRKFRQASQHGTAGKTNHAHAAHSVRDDPLVGV
jgi:hypothetical protein